MHVCMYVSTYVCRVCICIPACIYVTRDARLISHSGGLCHSCMLGFGLQ